MSDAFSQFTKRRFCHLGEEKDVFVAGKGPIVVLLQESPNPTPEIFELGLRLVKNAYRVYIPHFFGTPNEPFSFSNAVANVIHLCIHREFAVFASRKSSPITNWLRAFCVDIQRAEEKEGIGLIGMCLTGNFALALLAEKWMLAPVLSQPSLPYAIFKNLSKGLHVEDQVIQQAKQREDLEILAFRFTHDFLCPKLRFSQLRSTFGSAFQGIEINSGPFNGHSIPLRAHSVLTRDFVNKHGHPTKEAMTHMLAFLKKRLQ